MQVVSAARRVIGAGWMIRWTALRIGASFVVPLAIGAALGNVRYGAVATLGAFAAMYAREQPYHYRLRVMLSVGCALAAAVGVATLTSTSPVALALAAAVVAGVAAFAAMAWEIDPPREFLIVLAFLAASTFPGDPSDAPLRVGLVLGGALTVTGIACVAALLRPHAPEQQAIRRALLALAGMLDALGGDRVREQRHQALVALQHVRSVLSRAGAVSDGDQRIGAIALAGEAAMDAALSLAWHNEAAIDPGWAATLRTIADSVRDPDHARGLEVPTAMPPGPDGGRLAHAVERMTRAADPDRALVTTLVPFARRRSRRWGAPLRRALYPGAQVLPTALRLAIAVGVGVGVGLLLGVDHGVWVGVAAAVVLQATNVRLARTRTIQQALGTMVGIGLAAALLVADPPLVLVVLVVAAFQVVVQATIVVAYGVAMAFITPIALLLVVTAAPGTPAASLVQERLLDTLIGCVIGFAARRLLWPRTAETQLPVAQGMAVEASRDALIAALTRADAPSSGLVRRTQRRLQATMLTLREVHHDAIGDLLWSSAAADARWPRTMAVQRLAHAAMTVEADGGEASDHERADALDAALTQMAAILQGLHTPMVVPVPEIPDHPAVGQAMLELRDVLAPVGDRT